MTGSDNACFVTHLECSATGERVAADGLHNLSPAGAPLLVRYDLAAVGKAVDRDAIAARPADMWRYWELLPHGNQSDIVSLGESVTPLIALPATRARLGGGEVLVKDEGRLPTGSFKARGLSLAVSMARALGAGTLAMPTAGNAGAALAAYASRAGMASHVFVPDDAPEMTIREIAFHGAAVTRIDGLIDVCGRKVAEGVAREGWFDLSTLKEPYRIEGKKTMGLELAEQLGWTLPDAIFYPTGGGTGLIGMWKAFGELRELGWVKGPLPRMVAVQSTECGPIVRAFDAGHAEVHEPWAPVRTMVHGVRVPKPLGDRLILTALYESGGFGSAVDDASVERARARAAAGDGLHLCPEGAACLAAYEQELAAGRMGFEDRVVLFNSATGLKSPMPEP